MTFTTRPELSGTFGMVASTHWLASAAGMATLEQGGNAFDAAVAAGLTLQVVEPHLNGPGGDAPILLYDAARRAPVVVCGQGPAPAAATIRRFRELGLDLVPGAGLLAACVPGAFDAWLLLLRDYGTLPLAEVMRFPIHYAEHGFPMLPRIAETIGQVEALFREEWPSSAELWLDGGRAPRPGGMWRNTTLAATWRRLVTEAEAAGPDRETQIQAGRDAFLRGFVAEAIAAFVARAEVMDSSGRRNRGLLSGDDMAAFAATYEAPVALEHRGLTVCKAGPWSQGPVQLQALALLEGFDLAAMGHLSGAYVHTVLECMKLAYADREAWYGDPAFADVPLETLLSPAYAEERHRTAANRCCRTFRSSPRSGPAWAWASRRSRARTAASRATRATSTSSTATGTWSRRRRAAGGCTRRPRSRGSASAWGRARRCSGSRRGCRTRSSRASARARRSPRRSRCATARACSHGARRAATARISGRCSSCSRTSIWG
jgi:gamma-glutamyltranspeptidase / glutathione hydrolase